MSQPSVTAYFNTRKRQASEDLRSKAKVLILDRSIVNPGSQNSESPSGALTPEENTMTKVVLAREATSRTPKSAVRNIQFDSPKANKAASKGTPRPRATRSRKLSGQEGQADIRESFQKIAEDAKKVPFEKLGLLSPRKKNPASTIVEEPAEQPAAGCVTPKKSERQELNLNEIKNRIGKSSRLAELKASIARIKNCERKLDKLRSEEPKIQKFEKIQLEIPVSPRKGTTVSQGRSKELLSPRQEPSPVKGSPTKAPAYQQYLNLSETPALPLPYSYRFLAEAFRCVDTVSAMLYNRKETITFKKLKPAVQELLRRNFTLEHVAQIKSIFPDAYVYEQEKHRTFGSTSKQDKYELVLTPVVEETDGRNTPDAENILKTASSMGPKVLLERRRKFYNILLDKVKDEHEKFLLGLETPMRVPKEKIMRWHPEFDVETCKPIVPAELPQPPNVEKATTAKDVLDKAKSLFNCGTRMEKALQRLADAKMTLKDTASPERSDGNDGKTETNESGLRKVNITVVDTPPATPTTQNSYLSVAFKGIPKALLEKVRARQAAKALEAMTRTPNADKEVAMYSRLPELAKILRNIFVAEKKGILTLEFVIGKLENSFRAKLTPADLEEHVRLVCKLLPTWASTHSVRNIDYLKLRKETDLAKVVKRLEIMANDKVSAS